MSCRVIGRTVEAHLLMHLCRLAGEAGCTKLRGTYIPTPKNEVVSDLFERFGFSRIDKSDGGITRWVYDLAALGPITSEFIADGVP
jgi:predicted enzyme involved in methoxymalonyl-ACP biosynthesis